MLLPDSFGNTVTKSKSNNLNPNYSDCLNLYDLNPIAGVIGLNIAVFAGVASLAAGLR